MERILVRATNWVGDAVMSVPALQALRERYPRAWIAILARPWVADLYARESFADQVIRFETPRGVRGIPGWFSVASQLRAMRFETAILFPNSFESAAIAALAGIPMRIGYARDSRGWLLTRPVPAPRRGETPDHQRFYYLELLRRAGILETLPSSEAIRLAGARAAADSGRQRFAHLGWTDVVGVSPGAAYGGAKRWLPERFAEAAASFAWPVAVFGAPDERPVAETVVEHLRTRGVPAHNFAGQTTLRDFIDLTAACRVFLTNDSGPMHIASALGVPTVAVFGATDDVATGPTGPLARVVREPVACSPCLLRECPIDHRCMTAVSASQVADTAHKLLKWKS